MPTITNAPIMPPMIAPAGTPLLPPPLPGFEVDVFDGLELVPVPADPPLVGEPLNTDCTSCFPSHVVDVWPAVVMKLEVFAYCPELLFCDKDQLNI